MPGKESEGLTHFLAAHPEIDRRLREAAEHAKEAAAEVEEVIGRAVPSEPSVEAVPSEPPEVPVQAAPSEPPDRVYITGKVLSAGLAEFITTTSMTANAFVRSSAAEIGELIGKELEATEAAESRRASTVSKSE